MSSTSLSVVVPQIGRSVELDGPVDAIARYLETTGFDFEIIVVAADPQPAWQHRSVRTVDVERGGYGESLRRGVAEAKGSIIVTVDPGLPYAVEAIGDAVAMIESGATEIVFGCAAGHDPARDRRFLVIRTFLGWSLPDPSLHLAAFSATAAHLLFGESKLLDGGCDLELAFLANKFAFRVERLVVRRRGPSRTPRTFGLFPIADIIRIRLTNRNMGYRAARRCPVCFSSDVWTWAQVAGNIVRACMRCKCRFLNQSSEEEDTLRARRVLRAQPSPNGELPTDDSTAAGKTSMRRLAALRRQLTARARVLEIGVRDGTFGAAATREFEYVGIDPEQRCVRRARAKGLEVYCSTLAGFVNTGPSFDAVTLFHVLENLDDPHDALARMKDLLKPGGTLLLTTFDTEGIVYLFSERKRMAHNFRMYRILYSRSALIELLEHSGFEIIAIGPDLEYRDRKNVRQWIASRLPMIAPLASRALALLPDPLPISPGSIRIVAKRRAGAPFDVRAIRAAEPTHAR